MGQCTNRRLEDVVMHWQKKYQALQAQQTARVQNFAEEVATHQEEIMLRRRALTRLHQENAELLEERAELWKRGGQLLNNFQGASERNRRLREELQSSAGVR